MWHSVVTPAVCLNFLNVPGTRQSSAVQLNWTNSSGIVLLAWYLQSTDS